MTEQEKEKVLHGINSCGFCDGVPNICEVTECPYRGNKGWCVHELAHDAGMLISELMEKQEPRVMTLEEVKQWCETHPHKQNPVWVEFQHGYGTDGWRVGLVNSGLLFWCKDKEARFWTFRPSDTVRRATPWK